MNLYLNNLSLLKRFIIYFRIKSKKIIERKTTQSLYPKKSFSKNVSRANLERLFKFEDKSFRVISMPHY